MRVLHIVPAEPFGGAQILALELAACQARNGWVVNIIFTASDESAASAGLNSAKEKGLFAAVCGGGMLSKIRGLRKILSDRHDWIIHLHLPSPWMIAANFPNRNAALIGHLHVRPALLVHTATMRRRVEAVLAGSLMRRCDRLIAVSDWVGQAWRGLDPGLNPRTVYNGIRLKPELVYRNNSAPFTVGMASRLSDYKGVEEFLELAAIVHSRAPDIRFAIAGDGPRRSIYEEQAARLGLSEVLTFEGFVEEMSAFWHRLDLAAFTAPFEPFGLRLIEPVGNGVPVVAYSTETGADEVIARCSGISAVPYADVGRLADAVIEMRNDPSERARMAKAGYRDVSDSFSIEAMFEGISGIYDEALAVGTKRLPL